MGRCVCLGTKPQDKRQTNCILSTNIPLSLCASTMTLVAPCYKRLPRILPRVTVSYGCFLSCRIRWLLGGSGNNCCPKDGKPQVCCSGQAKPCNELKKEMNIISANCVNFLCRTLFLENSVPVIYCLYERKFWTVLELFFLNWKFVVKVTPELAATEHRGLVGCTGMKIQLLVTQFCYNSVTDSTAYSSVSTAVLVTHPT